MTQLQINLAIQIARTIAAWTVALLLFFPLGWLVLTAFNALAIAAFTVDRWATERQRLMEGLRRQLDTSARALPEMLPDGYLDRARGPTAVPESEYKAIVDTLSAFCRDTGLTYLYSYARSDDAFFCTSSNGTPEELAEGTYARYWGRYNTAPPAIHKSS